MLKDMTALVRRTKEQKAGTASYQGGRMPLSGYLAEVMPETIAQAEELAGTYEEYAMLAPLLDLQRNRTAIPAPDELLVEYSDSEDGVHLFFIPSRDG